MMSILHISFYINSTLIESAAMNFEMKTLEDQCYGYLRNSVTWVCYLNHDARGNWLTPKLENPVRDFKCLAF